jgi:hypothetical protein
MEKETKELFYRVLMEDGCKGTSDKEKDKLAKKMAEEEEEKKTRR